MLLSVGIVGALALAAVASAAPSSSAATASNSEAAAKTLRFRVTIKNLGRAGLTSIVYAVHNRSPRLYRLGKKASPGLAALAEDGSTGELVSEARGKRGVRSANVGPGISPRKSVSFVIETTRKHLRLSWATMQKCTNDAFLGQSSARLPARRVGARKVMRIRANDAGSEQNTESSAHVPCLGAHGVGPDENRVVRRHPGIQGTGDVDDATQGWGRFLGRIVVKRIA